MQIFAARQAQTGNLRNVNKRPGHVNVTTEVAFCSFCGRPRTLRREERQLGTLVRTIVTCETCHRTLSSTIGVAGAEPAAAETAEAKTPATEAPVEHAKPAAPATKAAPAKRAPAKRAPATKGAAPKTKFRTK
jgi:septal ring-binding cell division protein DamX